MSLEHPVSRAIFDADVLTVAGGPWGAEGRDLPLALLASRTLCADHNAALSPLDAAVGVFARKARALNHAAARGRAEIDGPVLERWCLKLLLGIVANGWYIGPSGQRAAFDVAPPEIARVAFGLASFPLGTGLHGLTYRAIIPANVERVSWHVLGDGEHGVPIVGLVVALPPFTFALTLRGGDPTPAIARVRLAGQEAWTNVAAHFRPVGIAGASDEGAEVHAALRWPTGRACHP